VVLNQVTNIIPGKNAVDLNLSELPAGLYTLVTNLGGEVKTAKVVKE
jgi:hypothetical protein